MPNKGNIDEKEVAFGEDVDENKQLLLIGYDTGCI